jgi:hypothetical protein
MEAFLFLDKQKLKMEEELTCVDASYCCHLLE